MPGTALKCWLRSSTVRTYARSASARSASEVVGAMDEWVRGLFGVVKCFVVQSDVESARGRS